MVLLSVRGMDVAGIAKVTFTSPDRVREVINNFNAHGFDAAEGERYKSVGRLRDQPVAGDARTVVLGRRRGGHHDDCSNGGRPRRSRAFVLA